MRVHSCENILSWRLAVDWGRQQGGPWFKWRGVKESSWRGRGLEPQLGAGLQISQIYKVREGILCRGNSMPESVVMRQLDQVHHLMAWGHMGTQSWEREKPDARLCKRLELLSWHWRNVAAEMTCLDIHVRNRTWKESGNCIKVEDGEGILDLEANWEVGGFSITKEKNEFGPSRAEETKGVCSWGLQ